MLTMIDTLVAPEWLLPILVCVPFLQGAIVATARFIPKRSLGLLSSAAAFIHFLLIVHLTLHATEGTSLRLSLQWFPDALVNFSLRADGLALFFSLLITGMGTLVFLYAYGYMNHEEEKVRRFYAYLNIFMGSMLGAVLADNMIVLFLFWEATSVTSFLLISYEDNKTQARSAARMAFLLNALASLALLLGFILIGVLDNTLELTEIEKIGLVYGKHPFWVFAIMGLLLTGIYSKSAQFPFHFWLPQAMAAPTPVSAYLHSATMVKLGIYLTARIYVLFVDSDLWLPLVTTFSLVTVLVGGAFALFATKLKQVLAYATVSQLGFFISFYGIGDPIGLDYDYVHIFNHALYKGSLFMLVGILAHCANATDIRQITGLGKRMPLLGAVFLISLAAMAGIPGTTGFLSKELLIADLLLLAESQPTAALVFLGLLTGLLFKVAFTYRLFYYAFLKKTRDPIHVHHAPGLKLLFSPFFLSITALVFGIWPKGLETLAKAFFVEGMHSPSPDEIHLWHGFSLTLAISMLLFVGGVIVFYLTRRFESRFALEQLPSLAKKWSDWLDHVPTQAKSLTRLFHSRHPERHLLWIFATLSVGLLAFFLKESPSFPAWAPLNVKNTASIAMVVSTAILLYLKHPFHRLILLSVVGFLVMFHFVLRQAPDVAMTQMVVEVATLFVIILLFGRIKEALPVRHSVYRGVLAAITGLTVAAIPLFHGVLVEEARLANFFIANALPLAKGNNAVNTILVDFRGLDTLGEIAVIVVAALGVAGMTLRREHLTIRHFPSLIPTPILASVMPTICLVTTIFGLYLLFRGHNEPGGGFTGGMAPALSFVLVGISMKVSRIFYFDRFNPFSLMMIGLALSLSAAFLSLVKDGVVLASYFVDSIPLLNTPLLFDTGIFLLVIGSVISMVYVMREHTLWEDLK